MLAAVVRELGQPPDYGDQTDPAATEGLARVRVAAAPLVPLDLLCASGTSYFGRMPVPYVPGDQGVGVVETSTVFPVGTRVFVVTAAGRVPSRDGSLAERVVVPEHDLVPLAPDVPDDVAAAVGMSGV